MDSVTRPLLIYDGTCGFCRDWVARWSRVTGDRVDYAPYQEVAPRFPDISEERFRRAVHLVEPGGRVTSGAEAVFRALAASPGRRWLLWLYDHVPGFAPASEACYALVAGHRDAFGLLTRWIWGRHLIPPGEALTSWIYLRILAVVYFIAFVSLWAQVPGLIGAGGILPAGEFLQAVGARFGAVGYMLAPTLGWLSTSDAFLRALCVAGAALSVLLAAGVAPIACLLGLWALYLSLTVVGQDFLMFQWDGLLLEAGFLAILLAPWRRWSRPSREPAPAAGALWLSRWLLFRLMFSSAAVKLTSHDPAWRGLTALQYHFETQPLPPWTSWYMHHLSPWMLRGATAGVFLIEGVAPFFIFAPRRIRFAAGAAMAALQLLIIATGNYCFFNLLSLALCVLLLDDGVWPRRLRERFAGTGPASGPGAESVPRPGRWPSWALRPIAVVFLVVSLVPFLGTLGLPTRWLGPADLLYEAVSPFRSVNRYGLFAVMTTSRPEIILEGSDDGAQWEPYEFPYKPGDVTRRPGFVAPYQPRLDWQMWFAALSDFRHEPWFLSLCQRVLQGSKPVLALLAKDPFPRAPPRYLRAVVWEYHFTDAAERLATGAWWRREVRGLYCPVMTLQEGNLAAVPSDPAGQVLEAPPP